jgi:polyhydroxybutyrate depolymerase
MATLRPCRLALLALGFAAAGCVEVPAGTPLGAQDVVPGDATHSLDVAGHVRRYILHLPPGKPGVGGWPLVLALHGTGSSADRLAGQSGLSAAADGRGLVVAYPDGTGRFPFAHTWHTGRCCGFALENRVDDVGFIRALLDELERKLPIDTTQVFVAGFSDGAMMTFRLGCELAGRLRAIAPVAGRMPDVACHPARSLPVIAFGGTADDELATDFDRYIHPGSYAYAYSLRASMDYWAEEDGCPLEPQLAPDGRHTTERWAPCSDGSEVVLYSVTGGEHAWPGGKKGFLFSPAPVEDLDATALILDFFRAHAVSPPAARARRALPQIPAAPVG